MVYKIQEEVAEYKKMLGRCFIKDQEKAFNYLKDLRMKLSNEELIEIASFYQQNECLILDQI